MGELTTKSGMPVFPIGIGTWQIGMHPTSGGGMSTEDEADTAAIQYAVSQGQNHIDTAERYGSGRAEELVGLATASAPREDLYIASKVWKTSVAKGKVRPAVMAMLARLRTDYLDMLYIHAPWEDSPWEEAIPQINQLIDDKVVRHFAVSNFMMHDLLEAQVITNHPIMANQLHYSCFYKDDASVDMRRFCDENNINIVAYRPLGRGAVAGDAVLERIAAKHAATNGQVALAWLLDKGCLPIPKAVQKHHIDENVGAAKILLDAEDIAAIDAL